MKTNFINKTLLFVVVLFGIGCGSGKIDQSVRVGQGEKTPAENETVKLLGSLEKQEANKTKGFEEIEFTNAGTIETIMNFLASDELQGRDTGSEGSAKAAAFGIALFKRNLVTPYFTAYRDTLANFDKPAYNVVGVVEGNDPKLKNEYIVIGAHYDHIGVVKPIENDSIANGANDDASGTTTVLELARYFGTTRSNKRSLIFVFLFFTGEEKGLLGSKHLAKKLKDENLNLYAMLNFEMVGVPLVEKDYFMYLTGFEESNLATVGNSYSNTTLIGFLPKAKEFNLFKRSDNYSFHAAFNVPSQTFSTFDFTNFEYYHKVGDEVDQMDFKHMAAVVNKSIPLIEGIANAATQEIKYN